MSKDLNPLVALGLGAGVGVCSLWVLIEVWPVLVLGGAAYLVYKGTQQSNKENITRCNDGKSKK